LSKSTKKLILVNLFLIFFVRFFARGIAAEPPKREMRSISAKVMERIARREQAQASEAARPKPEKIKIQPKKHKKLVFMAYFCVLTITKNHDNI
jgi:hypothetical protein